MKITNPKVEQVKAGMMLEWTDGVGFPVVGEVIMKDGTLCVQTRPNLAHTVKVIVEHSRNVVAYTPDQVVSDALLGIAKRHFFVETLTTRNRDELDFHNISVDCMRSALKEAFELGKNSK